MTTRFCVRCGTAFPGGGALCPSCAGSAGDVQGEVMVAAAEVTVIASVPTRSGGRDFSDEQSVPAVWQPGDRLVDLYDVRGVLGEGGMGTVYRVCHLGWDMDLAVKSPRPEMLAGPAGIDAFVAEAGTWVELGLHPNIVTCHFVRVLGGIPRVFAELVEGGSLADWIADRRLYRGGPQEALARMLDVAVQFARGLGYAHDRGLVHQDVKPGNVLLTPAGVVKVTDFGLTRSRGLDVAGDTGSRVVQGAGGSPAYYSPEQAEAVAAAGAGIPMEQRPRLTRRTDVWSWGISVLEMFTGGCTWRWGNAAASTLEAYLERGTASPGIPAMPAGLTALLERCFAAAEGDRPEGFDAVAARLESVYREVTGAPYPREAPRPADLLAASLTNRAVSYLEIGRRADAFEALRAAQEADPDLPELVYDKALADWHGGRITDLQAVERVMACAAGRAGDRGPVQLAAWLHLERRDRDAARALAADLGRLGAPPREVARLTADLEDPAARWAGQAAAVAERAEPLSDTIITGDGRTVVTCGSERRAITIDSAGAGGVVQVIDGGDGSLRGRMVVPYGQLYCAAFAPGGDTFFTAGQGGSVVELETGAPLMAAWEAEVGGLVTELAVTGRHFLALVNPSSYVGGGRVVVWDLHTRSLLRELSQRGQTLTGLAAAGGVVAAGGNAWTGRGDFVIHRWDLESGAARPGLGEGLALRGAVTCLALLAETNRLVSGHADGDLRLWDLETGECVATLAGHTTSVQDLVAHPRCLVSAAEDHTVRVWDPETGVCLRTLQGHEDGLRGIGLSADGTRLASGSRDGDVRIWDLSGLPQRPRRWAICTIESAEQAAGTSSRFSALEADARAALDREDWPGAAAVAREARALPGMERHRDSLRLWRDVAAHGRPGSLAAAWTAAELPGHSGAIRAVAIDREGRRAASGGADGTIRVWDLATGECLRTEQMHEGGVWGVAFLPGGDEIAGGGADGALSLLPVDGPPRVLHRGKRPISVVAVSADGRYVVGADTGGMLTKPVIRVHDRRRDKTFTLGSHRRMANISCLAPVPDGRHLLVGEIDLTSKGAGFTLHGVLRLFDLDDRSCVRVFDAEDYPPVAAVVAGDGRTAVTTCWARDLAVWDLESDAVVQVIEGQRGGQPDLAETRSLALRGDGRVAMNGGDDGRMRLWDVAAGRLIREFEAHPGDARACAWSGDARVAVTGGDDGNLRVWGLEWEYDFPPAADDVAAAMPYVRILSTLRRRLPGTGDPDADAAWIHDRLGDAGVGWMRRPAVRRLVGVA